MRIASIDIGTNTCLLLIANIDEAGNIHLVDHHQRFPRIGKYVDSQNIIQPEAFQEISIILSEYQTIANHYRVDCLVAGATSAVRDAQNKEAFLSFLKESTGIAVELISGMDEAYLTYTGVINGVVDKTNRFVVLDIGGGSTEISYRDADIIRSKSLQIGAVRITERFFSSQPPRLDELHAGTEYIDHILQSVDTPPIEKSNLIGVAGTVTTLACLVQGLKKFELDKISGFSLSYFQVEHWFGRLTEMSTEEILRLSDTTLGRADILVGGVLILSRFMKIFGFSEITVSERGLRYGLALRAWERIRKKI